MDARLRQFVRQRAANRCEYCRMAQASEPLLFHIEHIVARQHGGKDIPENLALACHHCNLHKGSNLAGLDPQTGDLTPLFHPRTDDWQEHFAIGQGAIIGLTAVGRATARLLQMNAASRQRLRHGE
jgi:hypothetical protein